ARELLPERGQPLRRAGAFLRGVAAPAARAEVHRREELEPGRVDRPPLGAGDADDAVLDRLAERLERLAVELRELVEEEDAAVGEADLAGERGAAAADERGHRRAVVRGAERRVADQRVIGREQPRDRVDPGHLERLVRRERGQDARDTSREHRLPGSRRPREEEVVATGGGELESAATALLSSHVGEVGEARLVAVPRR